MGMAVQRMFGRNGFSIPSSNQLTAINMCSGSSRGACRVEGQTRQEKWSGKDPAPTVNIFAPLLRYSVLLPDFRLCY
jgi:hypothetical protein